MGQTTWTLTGTRVLACEYGENRAQQPAALYRTGGEDPLALDQFVLLAGREPSYNNLAEIDRQLQTVTHVAAAFDRSSGGVPLVAVGTKHGNPCGAAVGERAVDVTRRMLEGDTRAIFGGSVMLSFPVDLTVAKALTEHAARGSRRLLDAVTAPSFTDDALATLGRKEGKCRCLANPALAALDRSSLDAEPRVRHVRGGVLRQPNYTYVIDLAAADGGGALTAATARDALLAWAVGATSNSNSITLVQEGRLIGNGVGQQDRVSCCELAVKRAIDAGHTDRLSGATAFSDSYFPFPDAPEALARHGVRTIVATSGSVRDALVREACEQAGATLITVPDAAGRAFFAH